MLYYGMAKTEGYFMTKDERLETLCEEFADLEEAEKDYILGVSQTLAHSIKGAKPVSVAVIEPPEYKVFTKENLA